MKGKVCNYEFDVIRSQAECKTAIEKFGYLTLATFWTGQANYLPSGCSIRIETTKNKPHFETSTTGLGNGRADLIPVCKKSVTIGKHSIQYFVSCILYNEVKNKLHYISCISYFNPF